MSVTCQSSSATIEVYLFTSISQQKLFKRTNYILINAWRHVSALLCWVIDLNKYTSTYNTWFRCYDLSRTWRHLAAKVGTSKRGGKQWKTTPKNLPRMQRTRATPVA